MNGDALDAQSLQQASERWPGTPLERQAAMAMIANDMNCFPDRHSHLAMLAFSLAGAIGEAHIQHRSPVSFSDLIGRSARVILQSGAVLEADAVVLTAPPSTWDDLRLTPALPAAASPEAPACLTVFAGGKAAREWIKRTLPRPGHPRLAQPPARLAGQALLRRGTHQRWPVVWPVSSTSWTPAEGAAATAL